MSKIMLVEDDKSLREIYGVRLLAEGYEITSAGNGEEALAMAVKEHPDLIISDVMMPKISGFDMLDILRATPETKDIKIIMMTALSSEDQRTRGETLGANRYLVKSQVGIEDVVRTVHDVLADVPAATVQAAQQFGLPVQTAAVINRPITETTTPVAQPVPAPVEQTVAEPAITLASPVPEPVEQVAESTLPASIPEPPVLVVEPVPDAPLSESVPYPPTSIPPSTEPSIEPDAEPEAEQEPVDTEPTLEPFVPPMPQQPTLEDDLSQQLPQPTAPFSTSAPSSLGDFINNPAPVAPEASVTPETPETPLVPVNIADALDQELRDGSDTTPPMQ